ncbi:MAG: hypothetical protein JXR03_03075 [Cyclobacteriaceae bacterium]
MDFQNLSEGLSQNKVADIIQDYQGYIWIATHAGLNRYDGLKFKIFEHIEGDSTSLCYSYINDLFEDSDHNIWVGTHKGLSKYDRSTNKFTSWKSDLEGDSHLPNDQVAKVFEDSENNLWVGTAYGLFKFNSKRTAVEEAFSPDSDQPLPNSDIRSLMEDDRGRLWILTQREICTYNLETKELEIVKTPDDNPFIIDAHELVQDAESNFWIATFDQGACVLSERLDGYFETKYFRHNYNDRNSIGNRKVFGVSRDSKNRIWLSTEGGGLNLFLPESQSFKKYKRVLGNPNSIASDNIKTTMEDNQGRLWVGTYDQGISLYDPYRSKFRIKKFNPYVRESLNGINISSFLQVNEDEIWIGTSQGITSWNRTLDTYSYYEHDAKNRKGISNGEIQKLFKDSRGDIWIGGFWEGGLDRYNKETNSFTYFKNKAWYPGLPPGACVVDIEEDKDGNLWLAVYELGLVRMNPRTEEFFTMKHNPHNGNSLLDNYVRNIEIDSNGLLWVGSNMGLNLVKMNPDDSYEITRFASGIGSEANSFSGYVVDGLYIDSKDRLWAGTNEGINLFQPQDSSFIFLSVKDGLKGEISNSFIEDWEGNLWVGTNKGLSKLIVSDDGEMSFKTYRKKDGLHGDVFVRMSCTVTDAGEVFFGGIDGFSYFNQETLQDYSTSPVVNLVDFKIFNKPVVPGDASGVLKEHINMTEEITLNHNQSVFSIEFFGVNFTHADRNQYAYMLEGLENDWNYVGSLNSASYSNLDAGKYLFKAKAANHDGVDGEFASMKITVLAPFWERWWFRIAIALFIVIIGIVINRFRANKIKEDKEKMRIKVEEATSEVKSRNEELQAQQESLNLAIAETKTVVGSAVESGNFAERISVDDKSGAWKDLSLSINELFSTVMTPFDALNKIIDRIAQGDLTPRYTDEAHGDVLKLAENLNMALDNLSSLLNEITQQVEAIGDATTEMLKSNEEMTSSSSEISYAIAEMSNGANEQTRKIDDFSELIEAVLRFSKEIGAQANSIDQMTIMGAEKSSEGMESMENLYGSMNDITELSANTVESITNLTNRSEQISRVVTIMKEVANQTNLLALNAAIEAAQAGEAGRGFSVVADEIRKLSESSKQSAKEIADLITNVQQDTRSTASLIEQMGALVNDGQDISQKTLSTFGQISDYYKQTLEKSENIVNATNRQTNDVSDIASAIQSVVTIAEETAAGAEEIASSAAQLSAGMNGFSEMNKSILGIVENLNEKVSAIKLSNHAKDDEE